MTTVDIQRSADRLVTEESWLDSRHSFSFGQHYDPANTHFGLLVVSNHDVVAAGAGFDQHPHRDVEILSWVLAGALSHADDTGNHGVIWPGQVQRISAGSGIVHSERAYGGEPVEFVQMWVLSEPAGGEPDYQRVEVAAELAAGGLVPIASGIPGHREMAALPLRQPHAALHAARLANRDSVHLPAAPYLHLYVTRGTVTLSGGDDQSTVDLNPGDAARITITDGTQRLTALGAAEILLWEMHATLSR